MKQGTYKGHNETSRSCINTA